VRNVATWRGRHRLVTTRTAVLCHLRHDRRLELFGSATRSDFNPARSDHDFLVSFDELPPVDYYDAFFSLKEGLEAMFDRPVDLVVERAVRNPYLRQRVDAERQSVYVPMATT